MQFTNWVPMAVAAEILNKSRATLSYWVNGKSILQKDGWVFVRIGRDWYARPDTGEPVPRVVDRDAMVAEINAQLGNTFGG